MDGCREGRSKNEEGREKGRCPAVLWIALMELPHGWAGARATGLVVHYTDGTVHRSYALPSLPALSLTLSSTLHTADCALWTVDRIPRFHLYLLPLLLSCSVLSYVIHVLHNICRIYSARKILKCRDWQQRMGRDEIWWDRITEDRTD